MVEVIDGRALASSLNKDTASRVTRMLEDAKPQPSLAVVLVGDDPASHVYVGRKVKEAKRAGIRSIEHRLRHDIDEEELINVIEALNRDPLIHGILVQLPLPPNLDSAKILDLIDPMKDVDGFHPVNVGRLSTGTGGLMPCTPQGCLRLLDTVVDDYRGLTAVVIGKSNIVGKPIALLLLERECTVTVTHIYTRNLADIVRSADIVVAAAGSAGLVKGDWVKAGAIVIDVGINRVIGADGRVRLVGDVDSEAMQHARAVTPVPGGVGPMTIACLLANTVKAAELIDAAATRPSLVMPNQTHAGMTGGDPSATVLRGTL